MIVQVRLKGSHDGHFGNIEVPFEDMASLNDALNDGESIHCQKLRTRYFEKGIREILSRNETILTREGFEWIPEPSVSFQEGGAQ